MPYSDYFALRDDYHPVISRDRITDLRQHLKDTYPHETFVELLKYIARMLSRQDNMSKLPVWIHGAFGTGKSHVVWALRELLICPPEELIAYFADYAELKDETELRDKFLGLKQGDGIVVAARYSSSEIQSLDDLVVAVYQSVSEALEERGLKTMAEKSLLGGALNWLADPVNRNILTQILQAEPYGSDGNLPKTGEAVLNELQSPGIHSSLLTALIRVARERRLLTLSFNIDTLVAWLAEIIELNNLTALVFIWDEFSDFLSKNRHIFGELQKLAEASTRIPFYLILVTHFTGNLFSENDPGARVIMDRFKLREIILPDYTAFKLLGHALKVKDGADAEWSAIRDDANSRLEEARIGVSKMVPALRRDDFKNILPFHPYAALILKNVAEKFDSNQRSMFNFVADKDPDARAFQYFIKTYGPEDAEFLAIYHLWDYFYATGKGKMGVGRENLKQQIRTILDAYPLIAQKYADPDNPERDSLTQKVLKTIVILQALRAYTPDAKFFRATEENLSLAFSGVADLDNGRWKIIADKLVNDDKTLFIDQEIYQIPVGHAVDQAEIQKILVKLETTVDTSQLIAGFNVWHILPPSEPLKTRFAIRKLTDKNFKRDLNQFIHEGAKSWQMKAAILFARDEADADNIRKQLAAALKEERANNILFIDAASELMTGNEWYDYLLARARQTYFTQKDNKAQADRENQIAEATLKDWESRVSEGKFILYSANFPQGRVAPDGDSLITFLKSRVLEKYPGCCDFNDGVADTFFRASVGAVGIAAGIQGVKSGAITAQSVDRLLAEVRDDNYWEHNPGHPLSKVKKKLEDKTRRAFASGGPGRVAVGEIVEDLMAQGFMPVTLYAYLTGYLLKEYASPAYRHSDGETGGVMDADALAKMLEAAFKKVASPESKYREQYIEVLTQEQRKFAEVAKRLFAIPESAGLQAIAQALADKIAAWGYPLWLLKYAPEAPRMEKHLDLFVQFLNPEAHGRQSYGAVAGELGALLLAEPDVEDDLQKVFSQEKLIAGVRAWLGEFMDGELPTLAAEIGAPDLLAEIRDRLGADRAWLWNRETCEGAARDLAQDYRLAAESLRQGFANRAESLDACFEGWRATLAQLRLPAALLVERYPGERQLLKIFEDLARGKIPTRANQTKLYEAIRDRADLIREIFQNSPAVFKSVFAEDLKNLSERDVDALYAGLPPSSFYADKDRFAGELKVKIKETEGKLKRARLLERWRESTGSESPEDLARKLRTPLTALLNRLPDPETRKDAVSAWSALANPGATEKEYDQADNFFRANASFAKSLADQTLADRDFAETVLTGRRKGIIKDLNLAREVLTREFGDNPQLWLDDPAWQKAIEELARTEYKRGGLMEASKRISAMRDDEAKALLLELARDYHIGVRILEK